ncbi:MerR family transcriptional regulator [Pseudomonas aeruginosa]|uniref:MerR family transcriptional regulator n=1 Tax=Pseudomonas aeruginosa TaxID=287 RepID=UPI0022BA1D36|nr:MerR family DNA-binding protein [Pseudomonas aeruginosa]
MAVELSIGQLAAAAGVSVETIRFYQRQGLLVEPAKPIGGHRRYDAAVVTRLRFIKRAQVLGFTLAEVAGLLSLDQAQAQACADTREFAAHKVAVLDQKMQDLAAMRSTLVALIQQCDEGNNENCCPIIQSLEAPNSGVGQTYKSPLIP